MIFPGADYNNLRASLISGVYKSLILKRRVAEDLNYVTLFGLVFKESLTSNLQLICYE